MHHLSIGNNVPLPALLKWFASLGRTLVVEWIPKEDPMVARLLASREDIFDDYSSEAFELAAKQWFDLRSKDQVPGSLRYLYVFERRD